MEGNWDMAGDKLTHDELLGRVLDLLEDICDDDEVRDHLDEDLF